MLREERRIFLRLSCSAQIVPLNRARAENQENILLRCVIESTCLACHETYQIVTDVRDYGYLNNPLTFYIWYCTKQDSLAREKKEFPGLSKERLIIRPRHSSRRNFTRDYANQFNKSIIIVLAQLKKFESIFLSSLENRPSSTTKISEF